MPRILGAISLLLAGIIVPRAVLAEEKSALSNLMAVEAEDAPEQELILYGAEWAIPSQVLLKELRAKGLQVTYRDMEKPESVAEYAAFLEEVNEQQQTLPLVRMGRKYVLGNSPEQVNKILSWTKSKAVRIKGALAAKAQKGKLPPKVIQRVIRRHLNKIQYCYEKNLVRSPQLAGKLVLDFTIGRTGKVVQARIKKSTMFHKATEKCILKVVRSWIFPAPEGGPVHIVYPFIFNSGR